MDESVVNETMGAQADETREGGRRRIHQEGEARGGGHGHRPHERQPGVEDMLAAGESSADLQERDPSDVIHPYIRLDATYIKRRGAGRVQSNALVTAIGVGSGGYRRLLRLDAIDAKPYDGRKSLPLSLHARGVDGVIRVTGDTHEGLDRAIRGVFLGTATRRRIAPTASQAPQPRRAGLPQLEVTHQDDGRRVLGDGRGLGGPPPVRRRLDRQGRRGRQGQRTRARLRGHRGRARGRDLRAHGGRQPDSCQEVAYHALE